jgi:hypothetical protein
MALLLGDYTGLIAKYDVRFKDNDNFEIDEQDLREFTADLVAVFGGSLDNVPAYKSGTAYTLGFLVRYTPAGQKEAFYYALKSGKLPAPIDAGDTNWKVVPGPVVATALSQKVTLLEAQGIEGTAVVAGRSYIIDFGPNAAGHAQLVTVLGTAANLFAIRGQLTVNGVRNSVRVNVASGVFGEEVSDVLASDNTFTGSNTFERQLSVLDVLATSVQNVALNTFSKLAGFAENLAARLLRKADLDSNGLLRHDQAPVVQTGIGLQNVNNVVGLLQTAEGIRLPPAAGIGGIDPSTGKVEPVEESLVYSGFIGLEPDAPISFTPAMPQFTAFFDAALNILPEAGDYIFNTGKTPPDVAYMRTSADGPGRQMTLIQYSDITYTYGYLPYIKSINNLRPDAQGNLDIAAGGPGNNTGAGVSSFNGMTGDVKVTIPAALETFDVWDLPAQKKVDVKAAYNSANKPVEETEERYFYQSFVDDTTTPGVEYEVRCTPSPVGGATVWKWRYYKQGK